MTVTRCYVVLILEHYRATRAAYLCNISWRNLARYSGSLDKLSLDLGDGQGARGYLYVKRHVYSRSSSSRRGAMLYLYLSACDCTNIIHQNREMRLPKMYTYWEWFS